MNPLWKVEGRRVDGTPVTVLMRDWGDLRPARDQRGLLYEAYQTEWRIDGKTYFTVVDKHLIENAGNERGVGQIRLDADHAFLESVSIDPSSLDLERKIMALSDHDGNVHSHLGNRDGEAKRNPAGGAGLPDRGHWVAPRQGEPLKLQEPVSTLPTLPKVPTAIRYEDLATYFMGSNPRVADARVIMRTCIECVLNHQPMIESQRRILVQAFGVLETLA